MADGVGDDIDFDVDLVALEAVDASLGHVADREDGVRGDETAPVPSTRRGDGCSSARTSSSGVRVLSARTASTADFSAVLRNCSAVL